MPQVLVNPYTPETPIGAGLQNIALALFGQRQKENQRAGINAQQGEMYNAHGDLYREQTRKTSVERQLAERLLRDQGADAQDELIAASAGVPTYTVRGYRDSLTGANPRPMADYADVAPKVSRAMLAVKPAYADKTINPVNIAQALDVLEKNDMRSGVANGSRNAADVARAFFSVSGHAPYGASETGSTDLTTGTQTLNAIGTQRAAREKAHARDYNAQAGQREEETASGVKLGPPVPIDSEAGTVYAPPRAAIGQRIGLNPNSAAARPAGARGDGSSTTSTELRPIKANSQDANLLLGGIDRAVGGQLSDPILTGAIMQRAQTYFSTPGSAHYGQHEGAARQAVMDVLPEGATQTFGFGKYTPKGEPVTNLGPIGITGPTTTQKTKVPGAGRPNTTPGGAASGRAPAAGSSKPAGKTDQQLIAEANDAVRKGANREAVMQRLNAWGIRVD